MRHLPYDSRRPFVNVWKLRLHFHILLLDATWIVRTSYDRCRCMCSQPKPSEIPAWKHVVNRGFGLFFDPEDGGIMFLWNVISQKTEPVHNHNCDNRKTTSQCCPRATVLWCAIIYASYKFQWRDGYCLCANTATCCSPRFSTLRNVPAVLVQLVLVGCTGTL
jgi:hypothetical protein